LRPGTLVVPLLTGFGLACELKEQNAIEWRAHSQQIKDKLIFELNKFGAEYNDENTSPFLLNFSVPGVNSEPAMAMLKGVVAFSNSNLIFFSGIIDRAPSYYF
jgi:cysteine desulfurase